MTLFFVDYLHIGKDQPQCPRIVQNGGRAGTQYWCKRQPKWLRHNVNLNKNEFVQSFREQNILLFSINLNPREPGFRLRHII